VQIRTFDATGQPIAFGSGFVVEDSGTIATNHHVIAGAAKAQIRLSSGASFPADAILADDEKQDLALLHVDGKNLPTLPLSREEADVGDRVVAIGSPLELENSISEGIVSGYRIVGDAQWVQTTAAASPGNSGGPLINQKREVVGVITWKLTKGESLNFAAPAGSLRRMLKTKISMPFGTASSSATALSSVISAPRESRLWTSTQTGRDYKIKFDGDYAYSERVNVPSEIKSVAFIRAELKRSGNTWKGKSYSYLPYIDRWSWGGVKWCRIEDELTITKVTETRIEGITISWNKLDVRNCKAKDPKPMEFALIPKD
jgi:hypothetical protein